MIRLQTTFVSGAGGFPGKERLTYTQLKRNDVAAVYERSRNGKVYDHEVFLIKVKKAGTYKLPNGKVQVLEEDKEQYPSSSQFGLSAWSGGLGFVMHRFYELTHGKVKEIVDETGAAEDGEDVDDEGNAPVEASPEPSEPPPVTTGDAPKRGRGRPRKTEKVVLNLPDVEFSVKELAELNAVQYVTAYQFVKENVESGHIKTTREERRAARGPMTQLFEKVA